MKSRARSKFVSRLDRAIDNVMKISDMTETEIREVAGGREGTMKAIRITADPTVLQANLAVIQYALGKPAEKVEGHRVTVPIQINMGNGKTVDVSVSPVTVEMA